MDSIEYVNIVAQEISDTKGQDLKILDLRPIVSFTDYFVLATGNSDRHVQALADKVRLRLKKEYQLLPLTFEGYDQGQWVLLDYGDFVVHLFQPDFRDYYALDEFWHDAPQVAWRENKTVAQGHS